MSRPAREPLVAWGLLAIVAVVAAAASSCRKAHDADAAPPPTVVTPATGAEMVLVSAGTFVMGSDSGKPDEAPPHEVSVDAFFIDRTEVTQEQYGKLVLGNPSHFKGADRPVEQISWADAALFCNLRSKKEGLQPCYDEETARCNFEASGYRLPTEAEWEYACRAGSTTEHSFGSDPRALGQHAWFAENAAKKTQPVAQKKPNAWGLCDMHGNVAEWCNDVYDAGYYAKSPGRNPQGPAEGERYVLRGGAWNSRPEGCRSATRVGENPGFQDACFARDAIGFRCVRRAPADRSSPGTARRRDGASPTQSARESRTAARRDRSSMPFDNRLSLWDRDRAAPSPPAPLPQAGEGRKTGKTGLVYSEVYLRHRTGPSHPEQPERLTAIVRRLEAGGLLAQLARIEPRPAAEEWLLTIHSPEHVARVKRLCQRDAGYIDSRDTPVGKESYETALMAAGGVLAAVDAVAEGKARNVFCAIRPPGHHATRDRAMGFCLLNNVAIAARYAQRRHRIGRVLIVDWDVHHGNGTQAAFDDDPTVFYFSVHQSPFYPGTGTADEQGEGKARGTKLNVPLPAGSGDAEYRRAFDEKLRPAALAFRPDLVLVSAGFDAHENDLLGRMKVTTRGFAELTRTVRRLADQCCGGRLVSVLEGGYHLDSLAEAAEAHVRVLSE